MNANFNDLDIFHSVHQDGSVITTYTYGYDLLKRTERSGAGISTLVWDGGDLLQVRS